MVLKIFQPKTACTSAHRQSVFWIVYGLPILVHSSICMHDVTTGGTEKVLFCQPQFHNGHENQFFRPFSIYN
jgi:hypothetical protein